MEDSRRDDGTLPPANSTVTSTTAAFSTKTMEMPPAEPASTRRRASGQKRKANNGNTTSNSSSSKRFAREKHMISLPLAHNGPCTRARQAPNNLAAASASASVVPTAVLQRQADPVAAEVSADVEKVESAHDDWQALEAVIEADYEAIRSRDANVHVIPIHCGWFSWTKVHPLEEGALPSFFNGKSDKSDIRTPEIYIEIRNAIMMKYHANPSTQIELKDFSDLSAGDLDARQEVMEFLNHWGLINFHPFPPTDSSAANPDGTVKVDSLIEKLYSFKTVQTCLPIPPRTNLATTAVPSRLFPEPTLAEELMPEGPSVEYHCNSCSADCSRKRYHCQKQADFDLCTECYNNGKFGSNMSSSDFILMEPAEVPGASGGKWTDQETLLLLEALELYNENWNEIAEHVATKTKAQCILHFVQMPIEDTFLDCDDKNDASLQENVYPSSTNNDSSLPKEASEIMDTKGGGGVEGQPESSPMETSKPEDVSEVKETDENCAVKALREAFEAVGSLSAPGDPLSFVEAGNPVMALAGFLARLAGSDVATASARTSLKSTSGKSPGLQLATRHCFLLEDPPDGKKEPDEKKEPDGSESAVAEVVDGDTQNEEKKQEEIKVIPKEENSTDVINDSSDKEVEDSVKEEKLVVSPSDECTEKSEVTKEPEIMDAMITQEDVEPLTLNDSINPELPKEEDHQPSNVEESSDDKTSKDEVVSPSPAKESETEASVEEPFQSTEVKDVDMVSDSLPAETNVPEEPVISNPTVENETKTGEDQTKDSKDEKPVISNPTVENETKTGEDQTKDSKDEKHESVETKDDPVIDKTKRAAITAISAAAVKAKLLADMEEDQIRQLSSFLIEKQLQKLETKLGFFNEMDSLIMRVREQIDSSRQRLFLERAQIITARLGLTAGSSRAMPPSLPANRIAMSFVNSVPRSPLSMASQRPPISRPVMTFAPPSTNPFSSTMAAGSSMQNTSQDNISSVVTK